MQRRFYTTAGGKEDAIRGRGMTPTRYYQKLNGLIDTEAALAYDALTVNRLRRIRDQRSFRRNKVRRFTP